MTPVCNCENPEVAISESGGKYCKKCGYWWSEEHGSRLPQSTARNRLVQFVKDDLLNRTCDYYTQTMNDYKQGDSNTQAILRMRHPSLAKRFDKIDLLNNKESEAENG